MEQSIVEDDQLHLLTLEFLIVFSKPLVNSLLDFVDARYCLVDERSVIENTSILIYLCISLEIGKDQVALNELLLLKLVIQLLLELLFSDCV